MVDEQIAYTLGALVIFAGLLAGSWARIKQSLLGQFKETIKESRETAKQALEQAREASTESKVATAKAEAIQQAFDTISSGISVEIGDLSKLVREGQKESAREHSELLTKMNQSFRDARDHESHKRGEIWEVIRELTKERIKS